MADIKCNFPKKTFEFYIQKKNCLKCDFYHQKQKGSEFFYVLHAEKRINSFGQSIQKL